MDIRQKGVVAAGAVGRIANWCLLGSSILTLVCLSGCAAPGPPLPPTLNLPQVVSGGGLTAMRAGGEVRLQWTTPRQTTDKLPVKGPITAEICRELVPEDSTGKTGAWTGCATVMRIQVAVGASEAEDALPEALADGPVRLLAYRVQLLNAAGRTAGFSAAAYAAAGAGPGEVARFVGEETSAGVELRWDAAKGAGGIELERTELDPAPAAKDKKRGGLPGAERQAAEVQLRAGVNGSGAGVDAANTDAGGMVDRTVEIGHSYRYTAQRVETLTPAGKSVELRGAVSEPLTVVVQDAFPPRVPAGLVAVPAFAAGQRPAIDLSWDTVMMQQQEKPRLAGYTVYRQQAGGDGVWRRLGAGLVSAAAYRDADVTAGQSYAYRVTATSTAGNESAPSSEAEETAPQVQ